MKNLFRKIASPVRIHARQIRREILGEPLNIGCRNKLLANYILWNLLHKYVNRPWTIRFENGIKSVVYPYPDHDAGEVNIWTRNVDFYDIELTRRVLSQGDFVVDAGCNVGNRTLALADMLGGALFIDAGKEAVRRTRENILLNNLSPENFIVQHKAVGHTSGVVEFTDLGGASTLNRVAEKGSDVKTVSVEVTTIDAEVQSVGMEPTFIKVDVEGKDLEALQGAKKTLASGSVKLVKFERNQSEPILPLTEFFSGLDWKLFALDAAGCCTESREVVERNMNLFACPTNFFQQLCRLSEQV